MADSTSVSIESLRTKIETSLSATHVNVEDMSGGCGQAFSAIIVSPEFAGKTMLARHRLVNAALKDDIAAIHAWTAKCYTPEQWETLRREGKEEVAPGKATTGEVVSGTDA